MVRRPSRGADRNPRRFHPAKHLQAVRLSRTLSPTFYYSLRTGPSTKKYLVPYEVYTHTTRFLSAKASNTPGPDPDEQKEAARGRRAKTRNFSTTRPSRFGQKASSTSETNRLIVRNLMENGVRDADGQLPGKTIVFARNHNHAVLSVPGFSTKCIPSTAASSAMSSTTTIPRAEQLIDDFKDPTNPADRRRFRGHARHRHRRARSGQSRVRQSPSSPGSSSEQMIGRGTRLCENLFGTGNAQDELFPHLRPLGQLRTL